MNGNTKFRVALATILFVGLFAYAGCILDPKEDPEPNPILPPDWKDLTEREHTLHNLVLTYTHKNIENYGELISIGYLWFLQDGDYEPGQDNFIEREADINMTRNMFLATNGQYEPPIDRLSLAIDPGEWYAIDEIGGEACDDCWETQRHYHIEVVVGETTYIGDDDILVQIVKDPATQKYGITRIFDIDK